MIIKKMDLVLQGPYWEFTDKIIESYLTVPFVNNIILSCWADSTVSDYVFNNPRVILFKNQYPIQNGTNNKNLQIVSSFNGLKRVTTKLSAKMRTDQRYTNESMMVMYDYYQKHKKENLIFVAGMFLNHPFSPRDHLFWGETKDLINLFDIPLEFNGAGDRIRKNLHENLVKRHVKYQMEGNHEFAVSLSYYTSLYTTPETYIGANYCSQFDDRIPLMLLEPEKYLNVGAPNRLESFSIHHQLTPKCFKSFPRIGIDLEWPKKGFKHYPYEEQSLSYSESWAETHPWPEAMKYN